MRTPHLLAILLALPLVAACAETITDDEERARADLYEPLPTELIDVDPIVGLDHAPVLEATGLVLLDRESQRPDHLAPLDEYPDRVEQVGPGAHVDPSFADRAARADEPVLDAVAVGRRARARYELLRGADRVK